MKLLVILLTFIGTSSLASSHFEKLKETFKKNLTVSDFKESLKTKFNDFTIETKTERLKRPIGFAYSQTVYEIRINYGKSYVKDFKVFLIYTSNDTIVFGSIQELDYYRKVKKSENFLVQDTYIYQYLKLFKGTYDTLHSQGTFIDQLTELNVYGFGCTESGTYNPPQAEQMMEWVDKKNYEKLSQWLREISPERQAYAITGLLRLKRKGIQINKADLEIIDHLKKTNPEIYHCSGCLFGRTITIEEIFSLEDK